MEGALRALVHRTIKVSSLSLEESVASRVLFFLASRSASTRFLSLARFPVDFNGRVRQSPSVVASDSNGGMGGV